MLNKLFLGEVTSIFVSKLGIKIWGSILKICILFNLFSVIAMTPFFDPEIWLGSLRCFFGKARRCVSKIGSNCEKKAVFVFLSIPSHNPYPLGHQKGRKGGEMFTPLIWEIVWICASSNVLLYSEWRNVLSCVSA